MNRLSNLKGKLLVEQIEDEIYKYILNTPVQVGQKLPNEFDLAAKFNVSRSTVREAVRSLSSKGIVAVKRGSGTYVTGTVLTGDDPLNIRSFEDKEAIALDLVEVRLMIEPQMAELAAARATDKEICRLRQLCEAVERKMTSGENYIEDDIAFHSFVAECSGNRIIEQLIPIIDTAVMMFVNVTHKSLMKETADTHRAVTNAIAAHDTLGARTAMIMHMTYNRQMIQELIRQKQEK